MSAPLTLPGSIPGLLRRGSPVFYRDEESSWTVLCIDDDEVCAAPAGEVPLGLWGMSDDFTLDLGAATGRAHAAWWLAGQFRPTSLLPPECAVWLGHSWAGGRSRWVLGSGGEFAAQVWYVLRTPADPISNMLRALDHDDPRLLPDSSRWVDAEALRLICLHVAGVAGV